MAARVAILIDNDFDDQEVGAVRELLSASGIETVLVAPFAERVYTGRQGTTLTSEMNAAAARAFGFAALIVPGGYAPDKLRMRPAIVDLVREAVAAGTPVGAISHGAQVLISADVLRGRTVTCWPSIATDVKNAGALYVDRPVVDDRGVLTARKHADVPQFVAALCRALEL